MVCLAILGVAGVGGIAAGLNARAGLPVTPGASSSVAADMAASDIVNLRFPHEWAESTPAAEVAPKVLAFAGDDRSFTLFTPRPLYPIPDVNAPTAYAPTAYAPTAEAPLAAEAPAIAKPVGQPRIALASASSKPVAMAPSKPAARSNAVLNDSQIASIKKRLNLRPDQERYWPAVEAELRKMLHAPGLLVHATAVRVTVLVGHSVSLALRLQRPATPVEARRDGGGRSA